jgi:F-type H+-transporting ATPase subunit a
MSGAAHSPLAQFEVKPLIQLPTIAGQDISFTNSSLTMAIAVALVIGGFSLATRRRSVVPSRGQAMAELTYEFVANLVKDVVGMKGKAYFPFIFTLFMFILTCNLLGMVPYSFTVTSHVTITFALAMVVFLGITVIAFVKHGLHFFHYFLPEGTPMWLAPLMILIELFSYLARPVSLSIRLAANMMAGHLVLKVIAGFVIAMGVFGVVPLAFNAIFIGFEFFVAVLQAYIFTMLTCVYLHDAIHLH